MLDNLQEYYLQQMGIELWNIRHKTAQLMVVADFSATNIRDKEKLLLTKMFASIDLNFNEIYFAEQIACSCDYLMQKIQLVRPKLILVYGQITGFPVAIVPGKIHAYKGANILISPHPSDLLKNPLQKKIAYKDLLCIKDFLSSESCAK